MKLLVQDLQVKRSLQAVIKKDPNILEIEKNIFLGNKRGIINNESILSLIHI